MCCPAKKILKASHIHMVGELIRSPKSPRHQLTQTSTSPVEVINITSRHLLPTKVLSCFFDFNYNLDFLEIDDAYTDQWPRSLRLQRMFFSAQKIILLANFPGVAVMTFGSQTDFICPIRKDRHIQIHWWLSTHTWLSYAVNQVNKLNWNQKFQIMQSAELNANIKTRISAIYAMRMDGICYQIPEDASGQDWPIIHDSLIITEI